MAFDRCAINDYLLTYLLTYLLSVATSLRCGWIFNDCRNIANLLLSVLVNAHTPSMILMLYSRLSIGIAIVNKESLLNNS